MKPVVEVIEEINSEELLNDAERFWIVQWKALGMRLTNLTDGGDGAAGRRMTVEHRAKIAAATMGNTRMLGKKLSPEARMKISASHKGEGNPAAKLSNEDVIEIRRLHSSGMPTRTICARFGIGQPYVSRLTNPNSTKPARVL